MPPWCSWQVRWACSSPLSSQLRCSVHARCVAARLHALPTPAHALEPLNPRTLSPPGATCLPAPAASPSRPAVLEGVRLGAVDFLERPLSQHKLRTLWQHKVGWPACGHALLPACRCLEWWHGIPDAARAARA